MTGAGPEGFRAVPFAGTALWLGAVSKHVALGLSVPTF
jgi:hypothetical protein